MNFDECYNIIKEKFYEINLQKIDTDFSLIIFFTDENKYIYLSYIDRKKVIEPVKHNGANIIVSLSTETFEKILTKQLDPFKAFTLNKIKAKGNVFLAMSILKKIKY